MFAERNFASQYTYITYARVREIQEEMIRDSILSNRKQTNIFVVQKLLLRMRAGRSIANLQPVIDTPESHTPGYESEGFCKTVPMLNIYDVIKNQ